MHKSTQSAGKFCEWVCISWLADGCVVGLLADDVSISFNCQQFNWAKKQKLIKCVIEKSSKPIQTVCIIDEFIDIFTLL